MHDSTELRSKSRDLRAHGKLLAQQAERLRTQNMECRRIVGELLRRNQTTGKR